MMMNLHIWHWEPEYPIAHLQTMTERPNHSTVAHVPPLRHGHSIQVDVEVVWLVVMVEVVVIVQVVVMVVAVVVVIVVVMMVVEGVGVDRVHTLTTGFSLTSFVLTKLLPSES